MSGKRPCLAWNGGAADGLIWPRPLREGDTIGLFAPAHHFKKDEYRRGCAVLESWGLKIKASPGIFRRCRYLAGDDRHRAAQIIELMEDDQVAGLMAVRGGYGCQRLLPALNDQWQRWPAKIILGFSDLTALHLARFKASGVIGFHGPMTVSLGKADPGTAADQQSRADLKSCLFSPGPSGAWFFSQRNILKSGYASGRLLGGNLTLVNSLLASPWLPDFRGAILILEDVGESIYCLDRLLVTIRQSPVWRLASGLVFGNFSQCGPEAEIRRLLREAAADFDGPVAMGAPFGHVARNRLFPIGAMASLEL